MYPILKVMAHSNIQTTVIQDNLEKNYHVAHLSLDHENWTCTKEGEA